MGKDKGYVYTRGRNPSSEEIEKRVANLEHGEACCVTASGIGAISSTMWTLLKAGDELVASDTLYGCTYAYFARGLTRFGVKVIFKDFTKLDELRAALTDKTIIVYFESPCNPTLKIIDIESVAKIVHEYKKEIKVVVDNTFPSPYLSQPLTLGADIVIHSGSKYINGHGDVVCGFVVSTQDIIDKVRFTGISDLTGSVLDPMASYLINRGMKTLELRMERHCDNAEKIVEFLVKHPAVSKVNYPGLESFKGHDIAKKQMKRFGGIISFELKASKEKIREAMNKPKLFTIAVSLGDCEALIVHPATMTHFTCTPEELKEAGISENLVRISTGLENAEDLINDLKPALDSLL